MVDLAKNGRNAVGHAVETCMQIALALRDEVTDLEAAGISAISIAAPGGSPD